MSRGFNKRGSYWLTAKSSYLLLILIFVPISVIGFGSGASSLSSSNYDYPQTLDDDLVVARMLNVCLSNDGKIIEYSKLTTVDLQECFTGVQQPPGFMIILTSVDGQFERIEVEMDYIQENRVGTTRYVLLRIDNEIYPAVLEVIV